MRSVVVLCFVLAGCANPLAQMDRLSDVDVGAETLDAVDTTGPADVPAAEAAPRAGAGLFAGWLTPKPAADAVPEIAIGTKVPYGEIARVCGMSKADLGKQVERTAGYKVFDTKPNTTAPRTFYVTGFSDGCARQFTAALVLVGTPSRHEELRYGQPSDLYPYSEIDRAYEKIKSRVCGVPRGRPCGSRIRQMERDTVFLSTYERFSNNARWADILIHDGDVIAKDIKS
jgi:hypothetical protein